jgi:two-component system cell cycle sensor histidine kinase/response regulator CckA
MGEVPDIDDGTHGLLFEQSPVPMFIVSIDGSRILHVNEAGLQLHGRSRAELLAMAPAALMPAEDEPRMRTAMALPAPSPVDAGQYTIIRGDGTQVVVRTSFARTRFAGEEVFLSCVQDITAQLAATNALRASEEVFRVGFDEAATPTALCDENARYIRVNRAYRELFRVQGDELIGRSVIDMTHPDDRPRDHTILAEMVGGERSTVSVEKRYVRPDGSVIWARASGIVLSRTNGRATLIMSELLDQTELRHMMGELRASRTRLEMALEASADGVYDADFTDGSIAVNDRAARMLGYTAADIPQRIDAWAALVHPDDMARAWEELSAHGRGERPSFEIELRMKRRDGRWAWVLDRAKIVDANPDGSPRRLVGTLTDISDRREAAEAINQQKDVFDTVLSNIPIMIAFLHQDGTFEYVNRTFTSTLGWSLAEIATIDLIAELYPDPQYRAEALAFTQSGSTDWRDWRIRTRDGRELLTTWQNVTLADGRVIAIGQDVSDQRAAEADRRQLESQLLQAQKLESLGVLAGGVAHDFNNLLVGILGNASLAAELLPEGNAAGPLVGEMRAAASRAAELTRQLLAYAGKGRFVIERVNVSQLAEEMAALLKAVISKNSTLRCELAADLPDVQGDATQLRQIVMNLITNASEALEDAPGLITLRTGEMIVDDAFIRSAVGEARLAPGKCVFVEVADTGRGMDQETLSRIFDPFFTTKFTGRGLGLAATLGIIRGHHGAITVRSTRGEGTTIRFVLPVATVGSSSGAFRPVKLPIASWKGVGEVLLADDEPAVRTVSRRALERAGFTVTEVTDGREALDLFAAAPDRWRAAVLDLTMPNLSGDAALRAMRATRCDLPAVLYSGYSEDALADDLTSQPGVRFLQKPFTVSVLIATMRDVLGEDEA